MRFSRPAGARSSAAQAALLFALALCVFVLWMDQGLHLYDEGITLLGAERISHGAVPHRDFYCPYGPGYFVVLAGLFDIFGHSVLVERVADAVLRSGCVTLVFLIVADTGSAGIAWCAALGALLALGAFLTLGFVMVPALAFALASVWCLWPHVRNGFRNAGIWRFIAAGWCTGVAVVCRYDVGGALLVGQVIVLSAQAALSAGDARAVRAVLAPFLAGAGLTLAPYGAFVLATGMTHDLVFDVVLLPGRTYVLMRSLPFPGLGNFAGWVVYLPPLMMAVSVWFVFVARRAPGFEVPWHVVMLAVLTLVLFGKAYVRMSGIHMVAATVSSLALLGIMWCQAPPRLRPALLVALGFAMVCAGFSVKREIGMTQDGFAWITHRQDCATAADIPRLSCFAMDQPQLDAIRYVRSHTQPGDRIFVTAGRHDKLFANDIAFYFLADRPPATKWYQMDPGLQTTVPIQLAVIADLARACPRYVIRETQWDGMVEANASAVSSGVHLLDTYLRAHFTPVELFGPVSIARAAPRSCGS
jgi:hypothetical protein